VLAAFGILLAAGTIMDLRTPKKEKQDKQNGEKTNHSLHDCTVRKKYSCEDRKKKPWRVKRRHWCHQIVLAPSSGKPQITSKKTAPVNQKMQLKILIFSQGLKLSNAKQCCRVSALFFFFLCEIDTSNGFLASSSY
jgi:hypothetical protein